MSNDMSLDELKSKATLAIANGCDSGVVVEKLEILGWYRERDDRPWYIDKALCCAEITSRGKCSWVIAQMSRNPYGGIGPSSHEWHAHLTTDRGPYWLHMFSAAPTREQIYRAARIFTLEPSAAWTRYASFSDEPVWEAFTVKNLDVVRGVYPAFSVGNIIDVFGSLSPDVQNAMLELVCKFGDEWDGFAAIPSELVADGSTVVALGEYSGIYKAMDKSFKVPFAHVWKFEKGNVVSFHQYTDTTVHAQPPQA